MTQVVKLVLFHHRLVVGFKMTPIVWLSSWIAGSTTYFTIQVQSHLSKLAASAATVAVDEWQSNSSMQLS